MINDFIANNAAATEHLIEIQIVSGRGEGDDNSKGSSWHEMRVIKSGQL